MNRKFQVGPWVVQPTLALISSGQQTVHLRAKVMDLLVFLAEHAGEVVTKDQLLEGVWKSEAVSESSLTRTMTELRHALSDNVERPTVIETIPKRGYRLIAPVSACILTSADVPAQRIRWHWVACGVAMALLTTAFAFTPQETTPSAHAGLQPRDLVLITRFENRTNDTVFDGAVEYALERELSNSATVGLVPVERVFDALGLMKKPLDTVIDRAIGREICIRDGGIVAMISGRIETIGSHYVITTQLINPLDTSVITTLTEDAASIDLVLPALKRSATKVGNAFGENRQLQSAQTLNAQASTSSLRAFQVYNQSVQLARQGKWNGAVELSRQAVEFDPEFASGWTWLAWSLYSTQSPISEVLAASSRAVALSDPAIAWERHWITGSHHLLKQDYASAARSFEALVALRPDSYWGVEHLSTAYVGLGRPDEALSARKRLADLRPNDLALNHRAAFEIVRLTGNIAEAKPYIDRMRALLPALPTRESALPAAWLALLPAYEAWATGDVASAQHAVDALARDLSASPGEPNALGNLIANFYLALGRLNDAEALFHKASDFGQLAIAAELREDPLRMRKWLRIMRNPSSMRVERFVKAGLLTEARRYIASETLPVGSLLTIQQVVMAKPLGRGYLELAEGRPKSAIPHLRASLSITKKMFDASYYSGCLGLATAFERLGALADAIETLEPCASRVPPYGGVFAGGAWLQTQERLARYYRTAGRSDSAGEIEQRLRASLQFADRDHPLLMRLNAQADPKQPEPSAVH